MLHFNCTTLFKDLHNNFAKIRQTFPQLNQKTGASTFIRVKTGATVHAPIRARLSVKQKWCTEFALRRTVWRVTFWSVDNYETMYMGIPCLDEPSGIPCGDYGYLQS